MIYFLLCLIPMSPGLSAWRAQQLRRAEAYELQSAPIYENQKGFLDEAAKIRAGIAQLDKQTKK